MKTTKKLYFLDQMHLTPIFLLLFSRVGVQFINSRATKTNQSDLALGALLEAILVRFFIAVLGQHSALTEMKIIKPLGYLEYFEG
mmetsp:Transcript_7373/g.21755  ORF Transcript_7373/g.21755 Transcript_7373/m.21755 type:complete len:85 (+) Transcript_7373:518-772(+)